MYVTIMNSTYCKYIYTSLVSKYLINSTYVAEMHCYCMDFFSDIRSHLFLKNEKQDKPLTPRSEGYSGEVWGLLVRDIFK